MLSPQMYYSNIHTSTVNNRHIVEHTSLAISKHRNPNASVSIPIPIPVSIGVSDQDALVFTRLSEDESMFQPVTSNLNREICLARQINDPTIVNTPPSEFMTLLKERLGIYFSDKSTTR